MPMHRKNKGQGTTRGRSGDSHFDGAEKWFGANVKRERNRKKIAKLSKRRNRK